LDEKINEIYGQLKKCEICHKIYENSSFTIFVDEDKNYEFMFVLQNPLKPKKHMKEYEDEKKKSESAPTLAKRVEVHRDHMSGWFLEPANFEFMKEFLKSFKKFDLIPEWNFEDDSSIREYIRGKDFRFYRKFFVTDLVKYWCDPEDIKRNLEDPEYDRHITEHLKAEIKLAKPQLVLAFGRLVWDQLKKEFHPEPHQRLEGIDPYRDKTVSNVHGFVFHAKPSSIDQDFFIIPLVHMSNNARNRLLRDSYFEYLREGLRYYSSHKKRSS
jgi:uracil-DNA glycosylase